jgi:hypothetical protein
VIHIVTGENYSLFNMWEDADATPNETIDVIEIMRQIAEDYNCEFTYEVALGQSGHLSVLRNNRIGGETPIDLMNMGNTHTAKEPFFQDMLYMHVHHPAISDVMKMDENPWHDAGKLTTMLGHQFGVHFLMANSGQLLRSVFTFNKDYQERYSLGNLYDMVFNKTWTWDAFESTCTRVFTESNGLVIPIAMRRESEITPGLVASNAGRLVDITPEGFVFIAHENDATLAAVDFLVRLNLAGYIFESVDLAWIRAANGEAMFLPGMNEPLRQFTRDQIPTEFRFGMLPTPIGPNMDDYVSAQFAADMWYILNDIPYPEEVAAVLVAMANRLTKINIRETELFHGLQDEQSADIMMMLLDRIVIDYSRAMGGSRNRITDAVRAAMTGNQTPVQAFQAQQTTIQNAFNNFRLLDR